MKVIAKTTFVHGSREFKRGEVVEMQDALAAPLIKARLLKPLDEPAPTPGAAPEPKPEEPPAPDTAPDPKPRAVKPKPVAQE